MTSDELKLKELAEAATPGPWKLEKDRDGESWIMGDDFQAVCMISAQKLSAREERDARLIAAAPSAILSLLARIERLEKELQHIADDCADANPPSYGGIRQAALSAIAQQDKGKETV